MILLRMRNFHIYLSFKNLRENEVSTCFVSCKNLKKMVKKLSIKRFKLSLYLAQAAVKLSHNKIEDDPRSALPIKPSYLKFASYLSFA